MKKLFVTVLILILSATLAAESIGEVETSGVMFKDKLKVLAFDDGGVTCYVAFPKKSLSFADQTDASISCRQTESILESQRTDKKEIFSEKKGLFFKEMNVSRFFDKKRNVLVYVSYTKKLTGNNANNSISVVVIKD